MGKKQGEVLIILKLLLCQCIKCTSLGFSSRRNFLESARNIFAQYNLFEDIECAMTRTYYRLKMPRNGIATNSQHRHNHLFLAKIFLAKFGKRLHSLNCIVQKEMKPVREECHAKVCCNQNSVTTLSLSRFCATFLSLHAHCQGWRT